MYLDSFQKEMFFFIIIVIAIFLVSFFIYYILLKKGVIKTSINYYTGKTEWRSFMEFVRVVFLLVATIFSYIYFTFIFALFVNIALIFVFYLFIKTLSKDENEELLFTLEYTEEDIKKWKEELPKKKYPRVKSVFCPKVVFTSRFIYLSKSKRIDVKNQRLKNFYIRRVSFEGNFMILHYYYSQAAVYDHYFYVPKGKQQKLKKEFGSHFKYQI